MQIQQVTGLPVAPKDPNLHGIVDDLINEAAPLAIHNRNLIINNISPDLLLETSGSVISSVLDKLFTTVIRHTQNSVILISAKVYGMTILVQVKSKGNVNPGFPEDINRACMKAQHTGGIVEMLQYENTQASVAYCFLNVAGSA
jgi:signal transduction histidine kinase